MQYLILGLQRTGTKVLEKALHDKLKGKPTYLGFEGGHPLGEFLHSWESWAYRFTHQLTKPWGSPHKDTFYLHDPQFQQLIDWRQFESLYSESTQGFSWRELSAPKFNSPFNSFRKWLACLKNRNWVMKIQSGLPYSRLTANELDLVRMELPLLTVVSVFPENVPDWICSFWLASRTSAFDVVRLTADELVGNDVIPDYFIYSCVEALRHQASLVTRCNYKIASKEDRELFCKYEEVEHTREVENSKNLDYSSQILNYGRIQKLVSLNLK